MTTKLKSTMVMDDAEICTNLEEKQQRTFSMHSTDERFSNKIDDDDDEGASCQSDPSTSSSALVETSFDDDDDVAYTQEEDDYTCDDTQYGQHDTTTASITGGVTKIMVTKCKKKNEDEYTYATYKEDDYSQAENEEDDEEKETYMKGVVGGGGGTTTTTAVAGAALAGWIFLGGPLGAVAVGASSAYLISQRKNPAVQNIVQKGETSLEQLKEQFENVYDSVKPKVNQARLKVRKSKITLQDAKIHIEYKRQEALERFEALQERRKLISRRLFCCGGSSVLTTEPTPASSPSSVYKKAFAHDHSRIVSDSMEAFRLKRFDTFDELSYDNLQANDWKRTRTR